MLGVGVGFDVDGARGRASRLPARGPPSWSRTPAGVGGSRARVFRAYFHGEPLPALFDTSACVVGVSRSVRSAV